MDQSSSLSPNPIVLFASFLLFLSYIYNKVSQSQYKSSDEDKRPERYVLEDHYLKNGPQVYSSQAQRIPSSELNGHIHSRNPKSGTLLETPLFSNFQKGPQNVAPFNDGTQSPIPDVWPSREPDLSILDNLSAIHNPTKTRLVESPDNSFDIPFPTTKMSAIGDLSLSLDIPVREENIRTQPKSSKQIYQATYTRNGGPDGFGTDQKFTTTVKTTTVRRGPVYHDSSDSEVDPKELSKGLQKHNKKQQVYSAKSEPLETINEEVNFNEKRKPAYDGLDGTSRTRLNETNFEPGVEKRRHMNPASINNMNNKNKVVTENTIKVEEVFPYSNKSSRSRSGKDSKDSRSQKTSRDSQNPLHSSSIEEENSRKKLKNNESRNRSQILGSKNSSLDESNINNKSFRRELLNKNTPLDISYFTEYGSNLSLKKYVAKKTVQEQAFRISDHSKAPEIKKSAPISSTSESLFGKQEETKSQQPKTNGLFSNSSQSQNSGSDLLKNVVSSSSSSIKPAESKPSSQETPKAEKKEISVPQAQSEQTAPKNTGLFSNLNNNQEKKSEITQKETDNSSKAQEEAKTHKSLFGGSNQVGDKPSSLSGLFSGNTAAPQVSAEEIKLIKNDSTVNATTAGQSGTSGLGSGGLFATMRTGGAPPKPPTAQEKPAETTQTSNAPNPFTQNVEQKAEQPKQEEKKPLFGNSEGLNSLKKNESEQQGDKKSAPGLFTGLSGGSNNSLFKPQPPPPQGSGTNEPPKEEKKSSIFGNLAPSSGSLFSQKNTVGQTFTGNNLADGMNDDNKGKAINKISASEDLSALVNPSSSLGSNGNLLNQSNTQGGSILANLSPKKEDKQSEAPKTGSLFSNMFQGTSGGQTSSMFSQQSPSKPTEQPTNPLSSLFGNQNNPSDNAPKTSNTFGGFGNSGANTANATIGTSLGLFSSLTGATSSNITGAATGSLFSNNTGGGLFGNSATNTTSPAVSSGLSVNIGGVSGTGLFGNLNKAT